jgi:outer membrane protein assembly factor BamB
MPKKEGSEVRGACLPIFFGTALTCVACVTTGQGLGQARQAELIWEVPANVVLPLGDLTERGLMPVVRKAGGAGATLALVKLDTGEVAWSVPLEHDVSAANVAGDVLAIAIHQGLLGIAVTDGEVLWQQPLSGMLATGQAHTATFAQMQWFEDRRTGAGGIGGAFLSAHDRLYTCVGGIVYALEPETGAIVWQRQVGFTLAHPLGAIGDMVLAPTFDRGLAALEADGGGAAWQNPQAGQLSPLFVVGEELYGANLQGLHRIDPDTGDVLWTARAQGGDPSMQVRDLEDRLLVLGSQSVSVVDKATGEVLGHVRTRPLAWAVAEGVLYYRDMQRGDIVCIGLDDLGTRWNVAPANMAAERLFVAGDALVVVAAGAIQALDRNTGKALWQAEPGPGKLFDASTWAADDTTVYFHTADAVCGYAVEGGAPVLWVHGRFFFVSYMHVAHDTLYLHASESLGAVSLQRHG